MRTANVQERRTGWTLIVKVKSLLCDVRDEECDTKNVIQMAWENIEKEAACEACHYCKTRGSHSSAENLDVTRSVVLKFRRNWCLHLWGPTLSMV